MQIDRILIVRGKRVVEVSLKRRSTRLAMPRRKIILRSSALYCAAVSGTTDKPSLPHQRRVGEHGTWP